MRPVLLLIIIFTQFLKIILGVWQVSEHEFPYWIKRMAGGIYNDSVYILGGKSSSGYERSVYVYQWTTQSYASLTTHDPLPTDIYGDGQYWSQHHHILYMIVPDAGNTLATYNMQTNAFISNFIRIPTSVGKYGCLASHNETLYLVGGMTNGGSSIANELQILSLSTLQWMMDAPVMNNVRAQLPCIASNNYLWAFGGTQDINTQHATNERIHIQNIMQNTWNYVDSLSFPACLTRCVSWHDVIYIVGGTDFVNYYDTVYGMDAITGSILSMDHLPYASFESTVIIANAVLYVFGGLDGDIDMINWLYLNLPTSEPTATTTINPTRLPSSTPTIHPTQSPTIIPTRSPTTVPTATPFASPTHHPSTVPSNRPTYSPTDPPSISSSAFPTRDPMKAIRDKRVTDSPLESTMTKRMIERLESQQVPIWLWWSAGMLSFVIGVLIILLCVLKEKERMPEKSEIELQAEIEMELHANVDAMGNNAKPKVQLEIKRRIFREYHRNSEELYRDVNQAMSQGTTGEVTTNAAKYQTNVGAVAIGTKYDVRRISGGKSVDNGIEGAQPHVNDPITAHVHAYDVQRCTDCGLIKTGTVYEDALFYCNDCAACYGIEYEK
eukprot:844386_1